MSDLQQKLAKKYGAHLICKPETEIVVEAYPRSGNTFTVDMLNVLSRGHNGLKIAHHTHDIDNVLVGVDMGKPVLILLREPGASIMSAAIFLSIPIEEAAARYKSFYIQILDIADHVKFCRFETVVSDFSKVFELVLSMTGKQLPFPSDWSNVISEAKAQEYKRAQIIHGEKVNERVGLPNEHREKMKLKLQDEVKSFMSKSSMGMELKSLYEKCLSLASA